MQLSRIKLKFHSFNLGEHRWKKDGSIQGSTHRSARECAPMRKASHQLERCVDSWFYQAITNCLSGNLDESMLDKDSMNVSIDINISNLVQNRKYLG